MGKFIITESEKTRILSLYKNFINEDLNNDKEDIVLTYTSIKRKGNTNEVYFNNIKLNYNGILYVKYLDISNIINELYSSDRLGNIILKIQEDWIDNPKGLKVFSGEISNYITNYNDITLISGEQDSTSVLVEIDDRIKRLRPYTKMIEIEKNKGININEPKTIDKVKSETSVENNINSVIKNAIASIYKNEKGLWLQGKTPRDRTGVINIHTLDQYGIKKDENWSILNYFNSAGIPQMIIKLFKKENKNLNPQESQENFNKLKKWIYDNKMDLFKDGGKMFNELKDSQISSLIQGKYNELKAYKFIEDLITGGTPNEVIINKLSQEIDGYILLPEEKPGSQLDRSGVDIVLEKIGDPEDKIKIQAKPNREVSVKINEDGSKSYMIQSTNIKNIDKFDVKYFIFVSDFEWRDRDNIIDKRGLLCFENKPGKYIKYDKQSIVVFNYEPVFWDPNY
jgi:hypothetical protein